MSAVPQATSGALPIRHTFMVCTIIDFKSEVKFFFCKKGQHNNLKIDHFDQDETIMLILLFIPRRQLCSGVVGNRHLIGLS
tara:strand:+ start:504 stop:746 length:243 start_codon:yes stop_codon:yes gene_type:complete